MRALNSGNLRNSSNAGARHPRMSVPAVTVCAMRPQLKEGLLPLWRDTDTVQIGIDPRRAAALTGLGTAASVLSLLHRSLDADQLARTTQAHGICPATTDHVLRL